MIVAGIVLAAAAAGCGDSPGSEQAQPAPPEPPAAEPSAARSTVGAVPDDLPERRGDLTAVATASSRSPAREGGGLLEADTSPRGPRYGPSAVASVQGAEYTWQDGGVTRRMRLQSDLVAQPTSQNRGDDVVAIESGALSIVRKQARHEQGVGEPVFRTESGRLVTFPGGVLIMLDGEWDAARVGRFFWGQGIAMSRVEAQNFAPNAFLVATEPGFAALELANALAGEEGVVFSVPDQRFGVGQQ